MYKIVGNPRARPMRVIWMMEELGQEYTLEPASPHSEPVLAGNPGGKIPSMHEGDTVLTDSVAICTYLADKHGGCTHPAGTLARARQDAMTQFCVDEIEGALWTASKNTFVNPEEHRCADVVPVCKWEFDRAIRTLSAHLGDNEFVAGDTFTVPDLLFGHCAGWAARIKFGVEDQKVADYLARMRARPAFVRATARVDKDVPL